MCKFFSFVTQPSVSRERFYFDWKVRKDDTSGGMDSHSHICAHYKLDEDRCNKWVYNPLTKNLTLDMQNDEIDDTERVQRWVEKVDWKTIIEPLVVKPVVSPFELPKVENPTEEQIGWLRAWDSVRASVRGSVWDSVGDSVGAYISSFFAIDYEHNFTPAVNLWESGLVPSFDGKTWRLHSGEKAEIIYEWTPSLLSGGRKVSDD